MSTDTIRTAYEALGARDVDPLDGRVAVVFSWAEHSGKRHEWAHLLTLREEMIVDMRDYASGAKAVRALHR